MTIPNAKRLAYLAIGLGFVGTLAAMAVASESMFRFLLSGFTIFALLPYLLLLGCAPLVGTRGRALVFCLVAMVASALALYAYADALFIHISSTSALVFVFLPLLQICLSAPLLAYLYLTRASARKPVA